MESIVYEHKYRSQRSIFHSRKSLALKEAFPNLANLSTATSTAPTLRTSSPSTYPTQSPRLPIISSFVRNMSAYPGTSIINHQQSSTNPSTAPSQGTSVSAAPLHCPDTFQPYRRMPQGCLLVCVSPLRVAVLSLVLSLS